MWFRALFLVALITTAYAETSEYLGQTIDPIPQGGSFASPYNGGSTYNMISYLLSINRFTQSPGELEEPPKVSARVFLGNSQFAGVIERGIEVLTSRKTAFYCGDNVPEFARCLVALVVQIQFPVVWTNRTVSGDWTKVKHYVPIDPCVGLQEPSSFAWLLVDPLNLTLVSDVAISSSPLRILEPEVAVNGDASQCLQLTTPIAGNPAQCDQFFQFDFTAHAPPSPAGYKWSFKITSTNGNPLAFSKAVVAGGPSCPSHIRGGDETWLEFALDPRAPADRQIPDDPLREPSPFLISAQYEFIDNSPPPSSPPPSPPSPPPTPTATPPTHPPTSKKPLPLWAIIVISLACILLATGALLWVWRLTRQRPAQNSYEIY